MKQSKERWLEKNRGVYEYDIYYMSGGHIFNVIRDKSEYYWELIEDLEFSTLFAISQV